MFSEALNITINAIKEDFLYTHVDNDSQIYFKQSDLIVF